MAPGTSRTVRLMLGAPPSITQFSLAALGRFRNAAGETLRFEFS